MKTKSKLRPYVAYANGTIVLGVGAIPIGLYCRYIVLFAMFALIVLNYLDGHFEKVE